jgi:hypothetical protein
MPANMVDYAVLTDTPVGIDPHKHGYAPLVWSGVRGSEIGSCPWQRVTESTSAASVAASANSRHQGTLPWTRKRLCFIVGLASPRAGIDQNRALSCGRLRRPFANRHQPGVGGGQPSHMQDNTLITAIRACVHSYIVPTIILAIRVCRELWCMSMGAHGPKVLRRGGGSGLPRLQDFAHKTPHQSREAGSGAPLAL